LDSIKTGISVMKLLLHISVLFLLHAEVSVAKALTDLMVTDSKGAELQLEARQMPLAQVLNSIAEKTHVPIHYSVLPEGLVTATCVGTTLKQVLECLLDRKADLIVRYPRTPAKGDSKWQVAEAWILGSRLDGTMAKADCPTIGEADKGSLTLRQNEQETDTEPDQTDELLKIAKSNNAAERADAIGALLAIGRKGDPKIAAMLEEALHDQDANVRAQAVSTLTHLGDNKESATAAIQEAMQDSSVDVRMMAVDGITDDVGLLQQAVNDSDEAIRTFAAQKLEQILQQNKTKP
jgi:HEAT repeats